VALNEVSVFQKYIDILSMVKISFNYMFDFHVLFPCSSFDFFYFLLSIADIKYISLIA